MIKNEMNGKDEKKFLAKFLLILFFIYVLLFQFILPVNKVLPKPTLLYESFLSIWKDYDFLFALIITSSVVYLAMFAGYAVLYLKRNIICAVYYTFPRIISAGKLFKYFPAFFYAVLFEFWFRGSYFAEFFFAIIAFASFMAAAFINEIRNVKEEYLLFGKSLGLSGKQISSNIIWKSAGGALILQLKRINYYLWVLILLFEFIADVEGIGRVYRQMLTFRDFAGLFTTAIICAVIIYSTNKFIEFLYSKTIHWNNE